MGKFPLQKGLKKVAHWNLVTAGLLPALPEAGLDRVNSKHFLSCG